MIDVGVVKDRPIVTAGFANALSWRTSTRRDEEAHEQGHVSFAFIPPKTGGGRAARASERTRPCVAVFPIK